MRKNKKLKKKVEFRDAAKIAELKKELIASIHPLVIRWLMLTTAVLLAHMLVDKRKRERKKKGGGGENEKK